MKFKIGDIVIAQNLIHAVYFNGTEGIVQSDLHLADWQNKSTGIIGTGYGYNVKWDDGTVTFQYPHELRKKRLPQELSSWDKVQEICGWNPQKQVCRT